jgi:hypothetical protein
MPAPVSIAVFHPVHPAILSWLLGSFRTVLQDGQDGEGLNRAGIPYGAADEPLRSGV